MKWFYRILFALIFMMIGGHLAIQWTLHELSPVIEQSMQILRGDHRAMMVGDYESLKGIHENKNIKKKDLRMGNKRTTSRTPHRPHKGTVPNKDETGNP